MSGASVDVVGVGFRYPGSSARVLDDLTLRVAAGQRVAVLGPNGSGKTTLMLHLNGLLELQTGRISVGGLDLVAGNLREIRRRVGLVFQDPDDQLFMQTVRDDVAFGPANLGRRGADRDRVVDRAIEAAGVAHLADRTPHHLSGGEKRRAAIAASIAMEPDVLVLDEPTSGLDPLGRRELAELLGGIECTQIVVTHDLPFALHTCERSVVLDGGRIVADGPTAQLLADGDLLAAHRLAMPFGYGAVPTSDDA